MIATDDRLVLKLDVALDATPDDLRAAMKTACSNLSDKQLMAVAQTIQAEAKERKAANVKNGPLVIARIGGKKRQS